MKKNLIGIALLAAVMVFAPEVWGQDSSGAKIFERQVRVVMGSRETQEECREFAKVEARRAVLDQVGVYIEGRSDLMQHIRESAAGLTDTTDMQKRVLAIAAGVTQLEVAGEEWKSEGGALVLYLTCRVTVHPDDVAQRLTELVKDRQKVEDYEQVQAEVARLREELSRLRADLDSAKNESQISAARESVERLRKEMSNRYQTFPISVDNNAGHGAQGPFTNFFTDTFSIKIFLSFLKYSLLILLVLGSIGFVQELIRNRKGNSRIRNQRGITKRMEDSDRAIADYGRTMQIDPNDADACISRGIAYISIAEFDRAIADFSRALQIDPNAADVYIQRGLAYDAKGDYDGAIADFSRVLQIDPNDAAVYNERGREYHNKGDYDRAIADYNRALQIDPNYVLAYYYRALTYKEKGDINNARRDFQRAADLGSWKARRALEELP